MHAGPIALAFAAAWLGAALYSVLVEQPARLTLDDRALVKEWAPSDRRALLLLALFALAAAIAALIEYRSAGNALWLIGAAFAMASWPYMAFVLAPINNRLLDPAADGAGARGLIAIWGMLEWGQVGLALVAAGIFVRAMG
ncbi:MAG: DUF1772 domain-containing protein [Methylobacteriaceae bacterium]|nr:DUF1772 domain-containing protein [Methylobacteriaceae bacterium]